MPKSPKVAKLQIIGGIPETLRHYFSCLHVNGIDKVKPAQPRNYSIYTDQCIACAEVDAFSDQRIKNITGISNSSEDLDKITKFKVTDYKHIDVVGKGDGNHKKLIAQDLQKVFPEAVNSITDFIPDVYEVSTNVVFDSDSKALSITTNKEHNFKTGDKIKIFDEKEEKQVKVLEVTDPNTFRIKGEKSADKIFVFGKEVDDFLLIDYEVVSMLNVSATQELTKQMEAYNKINKELQKQNQTLKTQNQSPGKRLETLEKRI